MNPPKLPPPYPLAWPDGVERTPKARRQDSRFRVSFDNALRDLKTELNQWGGQAVITSEVAGIIPPDTLPDIGIAVWIVRKGVLRCICCDQYRDLRSNVRAVSLSMQCLRQLDAYSPQIFDQVVPKAVPSLPGKRTWRSVLGELTRVEQVEVRFRELAKSAHPDAGGSDDEMAILNNAREEALQEFSESN